MLKRTPLFESHRKLGGKLVAFGGWEMPVQYSSIVDEHLAVRNAAGVFDISHMGEVRVSGAAAADFLDLVLTNDIRKLSPGRGQYTLMCNERGGTIDDLYVYQTGGSEFLLIVNAARVDVDVTWLETQWSGFNRRDEVELSNQSDLFGAVALQGPRARQFINSCVEASRTGRYGEPSALKKNQMGRFFFDGTPVEAACTGYTGEDGFELVAPADALVPLWKRILEAGRPFDLKPCGLGARDTLRTEMGYPLYGHELDEDTTPIEAGLGFAVALDKRGFVGRDVLARQKSDGVEKKCVAFRMTGKSAPPRPHYPIWSCCEDSRGIGAVVSGTQSPSLGGGIGMGYVPPEFAKSGTSIEIEIRGRRAPAVVVAKPIYKKPV